MNLLLSTGINVNYGSNKTDKIYQNGQGDELLREGEQRRFLRTTGRSAVKRPRDDGASAQGGRYSAGFHFAAARGRLCVSERLPRQGSLHQFFWLYLKSLSRGGRENRADLAGF